MARIILGISGSVTAYKGAELARAFVRAGHEVRGIITAGGQKFVTPLQIQALTGNPVPVDQWRGVEKDGIDHIHMARWADAIVVAPASANCIARLAGGIADDLLTGVALAFTGPLFIAPSMNSKMLAHPATSANIEVLQRRGVLLLESEEGDLACGEHGPGRMMDPERIVEVVGSHLVRELDYSGVRALITAGPTHEPLDPVRVFTNRSSGRMGFALAQALTERGASVRLVHGPTSLEVPEDLQEVVGVETAAEMEAALRERFEECDLLIMAAAVADWRPSQNSDVKAPRSGGPVDITLEPTPDIVAGLCAGKGSRVVVGFALESGDPVKGGKEKIKRKGLDAIAVNDPAEEGAGPEGKTNRITLVHADGRVEEFPLQSKLKISHQLLDSIHLYISVNRGG